MSVVDPLPAGAMTFGGKTHGPAVNLGRARPHQIGGRMIYMHLDELRDAVVSAGWHTERDYAQLEQKFAAECDARTALREALDEAHEKIEALEKALGWKPKENPTNGDGEDRERQLQEGRTAPVARSAAGSEDPGVKDGGGKGRKVRAAGKEAS